MALIKGLKERMRVWRPKPPKAERSEFTKPKDIEAPKAGFEIVIKDSYAERQAEYMRTFAERVSKAIESVDARVVDCVRALDVTLYGIDDKPVPFAGFNMVFANGLYDMAKNSITLVVSNIVQTGSCVNLVLAHEVIHATGYFKLLNRGAVGRGSRYLHDKGNPFDVLGQFPRANEEEYHREERVAQYGALLLLKALGVESVDADKYTQLYLKNHGRDCGTPDAEDYNQAVEAVNFVLMRVNASKTFKGEQYAA